ncbi:hypothetical protein Pcinc_043928 [Petrolisthes cinctipes]|uniref:Uncharacterized protein n=1 Tax=Petrolisthes cinctipes TaxID=88211 RepID=A0AAE1EFU4_PETCI|nr:hypothetical protein Pcinc_043928 [Petrolisthes cinctipes]
MRARLKQKVPMQAASTVGVVNVDMLVVKRFETGRMAVPRHRDDQLDPHRLRGVYGPVYEGRGELVRHCLGRHERLLCIVVGPVSVRPSVRPSTCPPHHHLTPPQQVTSGPQTSQKQNVNNQPKGPCL